MSKTSSFIKSLGPGLVFAGAAIGVSHLVQSTKAGAQYGYGLAWAILLANLLKYPFFLFGPLLVKKTNKNLIEGYASVGKWTLILYFIVNLVTMFTIQTAVTVVTAGLAASLFQLDWPITVWCAIVSIVCFALLFKGQYKILDRSVKYIVIALTISTFIAFIAALLNTDKTFNFSPFFPKKSIDFVFLIAFLGWMPAPLDVSIWQSIWSKEKIKTSQKAPLTFDFNLGYIGTACIAFLFLGLGALVMFQSGEPIANGALPFAKQLIGMYTKSLGPTFYFIIGFAALATMFSTTLTTLDASPRVMDQIGKFLFPLSKGTYFFWLVILSIGTNLIFLFFSSEMGLLVKIATIFSFLSAPLIAILNYIVYKKHFKKYGVLDILALLGIVFLLAFGFWYLKINF